MLLSVTVVAGFRDVRLDLDRTVVGSAETTGTTVFTMWVLPFEVLSVLLLAALVGAIVLSRLAGRVTTDAAVVAAAGREPAVRDRGVRRARRAATPCSC